MSLVADEERDGIGKASIVKSIIPESAKQAEAEVLSYARTRTSSLSNNKDER